MKSTILVCALYKFVSLTRYKSMQKPILMKMEKLRIKGSLLLAKEGINGTIAGYRKDMDSFLKFLKKYPQLKDLEQKESVSSSMPFLRSKVRLKKEIVTMGVEGINPNRVKGTYVRPQDWNALIKDPDVTVIDTRNDYEVKIGTFKKAINPKTKSFREFPKFVKKKLNPKKHKKVAMFCTGGIRCEKSTAYLKENGFNEVYHLKGGILKYLEKVPKAKSLWKGECFVFDGRVAVKHGLKQGTHEQCYACRRPLSPKDKKSRYYKSGVSCPACYKKTSIKRKKAFQEREKQVRLAEKAGRSHLGGD